MSMSDAVQAREAAEERVHQFMVEFEAQWHIAAPAFAERDPDNPRRPFERWNELMAQTTQLRECSPQAPFRTMPEPEARLDEVRNFTEREVTQPGTGETSQA